MEWWLLDALQTWHNPLLDTWMVFITRLGNAGAIWIALGLVLLIFKKTRPVGIQVLIVLLIGALIGNVFLKNVIQRARPCWNNEGITLLIANPKDFSFPSGHTLASFSSATILFLNHRKWGALALVLASLMGFTRLYLYVHFPSDVIFSVFLGVCIAFTVTKVWKNRVDKMKV